MLIVEDDGDLARLQSAILAGYATVTVISDEFERTLLPETWLGIDVAVIDLMLPGLEGEDICRYLRDQQPYVRRVICTAKPMNLISDLRDLADVILQKPFGADDFLDAVLAS